VTVAPAATQPAPGERGAPASAIEPAIVSWLVSPGAAMICSVPLETETVAA
jgi:hypothetical protein